MQEQQSRHAVAERSEAGRARLAKGGGEERRGEEEAARASEKPRRELERSRKRVSVCLAALPSERVATSERARRASCKEETKNEKPVENEGHE